MTTSIYHTPKRNTNTQNISHTSPLSTDDSENQSKFSNSKPKIHSQSVCIVREIFRLGLRFDIPIDTVHLAIAWAQSFQSVSILDYAKGLHKMENIDKLAIIFTSLSCKFNECCQILISDLAYKYPSNIHAQLLELEERILKHMQFQVPETSPTQIFQHYLGIDEKKRQKCQSLFMKYMLDQDYNELGWQIICKIIVHSLEPQSWEEQDSHIRLQIKTLAKNVC